VEKQLPKKASVVIIGGGIIGTSVAYHLTKRGCTDVVLLERKQLTCGTTWHAAGLVGQLRATKNLTQLAKYTSELYAKLAETTGLETGFTQRGSISLATTVERFEELKRQASMARCFGVEVAEISPDEASEMWPLMDFSDVIGAVHLPKDGQTNPTDTTQALAKGARLGGAAIFENTKVNSIVMENERAVGVETSLGSISADYVVNCAGMWGREIGKTCGAKIPLHAAEHYYLVTEPMEGMHSNLPVLRDQDRFSYFKEDAGKLLLGFFEPNAVPWGMNGIPEQFCFDDLPADWDRMIPYIEGAMKRLPVLADTGIQLLFNGPESFTPDDRYLLGESPDVKGLFVAAGFNSVGIQSAGGAGKVLADWIIDGHSPMDLWDVDINRMMPFQNNSKYLHDRTTEVLGALYDMHWPYKQMETARGVRTSALHDRLLKQGACFGEAAGWERANWYAPKGMEPEYQYSYGRQNWFECNAAEHIAVREAVGLFDQSSFSKLLVQGRDAESTLNRICANNVSVPVGKAVYTQWLNPRGTIEADLTVTRMGQSEYLVVTAGATHVHVETWLKRNTPKDAFVTITDVTAGLVTINVQGPLSRKMLSQLTPSDMSNEAFPFATMQKIEIGYATVDALRLTYMGELGWELYVPSDFAQGVYDTLVENGEEFGLRHCGYHALQSLRMEKAYREYGHDVGSDDTPLNAGLGFACDFDKPGGFIGKEALLQQKEAGVNRRLVQFLMEDPEVLLYHDEPIYRDGKMLGYTTSAMYGHTLRGSVALGYIQHTEHITADFINSGNYQIEVAGKRYPARASLRPLYDPKSERIKS
jgi:heterotetrameric sarcosine oxidase gamma subunit